MKCKYCQAENFEKRQFCSECGHRLGVLCRLCDYPNENDDKFCGGCGASLQTMSSTTDILFTLSKHFNLSSNDLTELMQIYYDRVEKNTPGKKVSQDDLDKLFG
jgi:hypothetical protein